MDVNHFYHCWNMWKKDNKRLETVLSVTQIGYSSHGWMICGDLKVTYMFLGQ